RGLRSGRPAKDHELAAVQGLLEVPPRPRMAEGLPLHLDERLEILLLAPLEERPRALQGTAFRMDGSRRYSGRSAAGATPSPRCSRGPASRPSVPARKRLRAGRTAR